MGAKWLRIIPGAAERIVTITVTQELSVSQMDHGPRKARQNVCVYLQAAAKECQGDELAILTRHQTNPTSNCALETPEFVVSLC